MWAMDTSRGRWVVKASTPVSEWQLATMGASGRLERAARAAGVSIPQPVPPAGKAVGYWSRHAGGTCYVRVSERLAGQHPMLPADPALATWLGHSLATIERLGLPADASLEKVYARRPDAVVANWLAQCHRRGVLTSAEASRLRRAIAEADTLVAASVRDLPTQTRLQLAHRDMNWQNILLTSAGPVLLDFDHAGPEVPWWELVHQAFQVSGWELGDDEPAPPTVGAALAGYLDGGGHPGPADATAFAGLLRSTLDWTTFNLWGALHHDETRQPVEWAEACRLVTRAADRVLSILDSLDRWATLLR
jgi:Ser/Thr protein kinase RdoA (MazF antagonist)